MLNPSSYFSFFYLKHCGVKHCSAYSAELYQRKPNKLCKYYTAPVPNLVLPCAAFRSIPYRSDKLKLHIFTRTIFNQYVPQIHALRAILVICRVFSFRLMQGIRPVTFSVNSQHQISAD
jgi:hypothetical protein